jgi:hypothetical protein
MRKLVVASITVLVCGVIFLMVQYPEIFSGSKISSFSDPLLGTHIVTRSLPTDLISAIMFLLGVVALYKVIRRRLADRKKGPHRLIRGGKPSEDE